jgi:ADP-heptose:LPS heptosyltransferase
MIGQLFTLLELAAGRAVEPVFDLTLAEEWPARAASLLPAGPIYIGRAPGAGGAHKRWPRDRFVALAQGQIAVGRVPVFLLGPDESGWHDALHEAVPGALFPLPQAATDADSASPLLTLAVAQRLAAAVANDSGTGHLVAASGCPLVSLFGPTRAEKFAPAARRLEIVDAQSLGASVMEAIPLDAVAAALDRILTQAA